ncbi:hypothetical protein PF008_g20079 [Phytophthora fragariae]|uniref:RxLR effector protein n=1 Tax=Phytophthora fragariae TaxID=53985 RepID=A0A6G0R0T3_9STRA|nr:hypothetical protein PF008_g20079 [Phytophthora fragariae]
MRLHYMLFVVASAFLLANNIVASADTVTNPSKVATTDDAFTSEHGKSADKRSLRIRETEDDDGDYDDDDEERGLTTTWWLQLGLNPKQVHTRLGLDGLGEASRTHKNYPKYLKFIKNGMRNNRCCWYQVGAIFLGEGLVLAKGSYARISRSNNVNSYLIKIHFVFAGKGLISFPALVVFSCWRTNAHQNVVHVIKPRDAVPDWVLQYSLNCNRFAFSI